jgi:hypothetical protein
MLRRQNRRIEFTGGLEALALEDYQVDLLASLNPRPSMFFAYDPGDAFETLEHAARRLIDAGFTASSHLMRCYCLIGHPNADGHAVATRKAFAAEMSAGRPLARLPTALGASGHHPRRQTPRPPKTVVRMRKILDADRQNRRPPGRPKNVDDGHHHANGFRPTGNSAAAALRRLERRRPDLLDRVLAGELSAHTAMIEAGFRKQPRLV